MNRLLYFLSFLSLAFVAGCKKEKHCSCDNTQVITDKYIYKVNVGSAEWNAAIAWGVGQAYPLDSVYRLCQIPVSQLQIMTTAGLVQSLKDNPCLSNMLLRDDKFQGRDEVLARLNVSSALNLRSDAAKTIIDIYKSQDPNCSSCLNTENDRGTFANNWYLFDMICTQDLILNQLDRGVKKKFSGIVIEKYRVQLKYPNTFGSSKTSSILLLSQIMISESYQPYLAALQDNSDLQVFALTGIVSGNFLDQVLNFAIEFTNT